MSKEMTNAEKFLEEFSNLHVAGVGVTALRTREPFRALDALQTWAASNMGAAPFKVWTMISGWMTYDMVNTGKEPTKDAASKEIIGALSQIDGLGAATTKFPDGTYVVFWPHVAIKSLPPLLQVVAELARSCSESVKRVVLLVPPSFRLPSELQESVTMIDFALPNRDELRDTYDMVRNAVADKAKPINFNAAEVSKILNAVTGMTAMEAESAIARAAAKYKDEFPRVSVDKFVSALMEVKVEVIRRSGALEVMPVETMNNVGGLGLLKAWVSARRGSFEQAARDAGVDKPKGVLFVGPPGTAKSLAAKATAHELGLPLIRFDLSKVYGGLVGDSESNMDDALSTIKAMAPVVVLVDEIDKAISKSEGRDGGVSQRVLGKLLTFLQENDELVFFACTANRVQNLPSELVRKGRMDEIFYIGPPGEKEREEIFAIHLRKRKEDIATLGDIEPMIVASAGHTGSEIEAAVKEAKLLSYSQGVPITVEMIAAQFANSKPHSEAFKEDFTAMEEWAKNNARPASQAAVAATTSGPAGAPRTRVRTMPSASLDG